MNTLNNRDLLNIGSLKSKKEINKIVINALLTNDSFITQGELGITILKKKHIRYLNSIQSHIYNLLDLNNEEKRDEIFNKIKENQHIVTDNLEKSLMYFEKTIRFHNTNTVNLNVYNKAFNSLNDSINYSKKIAFSIKHIKHKLPLQTFQKIDKIIKLCNLVHKICTDFKEDIITHIKSDKKLLMSKIEKRKTTYRRFKILYTLFKTLHY